MTRRAITVPMSIAVLAYSSLIGAAPKDVNVVNDATNPVLIEDNDNPARRPVQRGISFNNLGGGVATIMTVPGDSRLVIEFVSAVCVSVDLPVSPPVEASVLRIATNVDHYFSFQYARNLPFSIESVATHATRMYAEPSTDVLALISPTSTAPTLSCNVSISGYLIDP